MSVAGTARPERVAEEFREILAEEIPRLKDPRVGFVTVTRVEVSPDLRKAIVYYTAMGPDTDKRRTRAGLVSAKAHLRSVLGHQVRMKFTPDLDFEEDVGLAQVERVTQLLKEIGAAPSAEAADPAQAAESAPEPGGTERRID